jgi:hypothetical protein
VSKNHSTNKERSHVARKKHRFHKHSKALFNRALRQKKLTLALLMAGEARDMKEAKLLASNPHCQFPVAKRRRG